MQTTADKVIPFPQQGWARHRIKPRQRVISFIARLTRKKQKLPSPTQMQALRDKFKKA